MIVPEPLTPADCDLRGLPFMPLDVVRLGDSDLMALTSGDEFKAAVTLWCKSWLQVPAASLPNDDRVLAHLSGTGTRWKKLKAMALHRWVLCADGRWYHPVIAEKACEAWKHRVSQRERVARRWAKRDGDEVEAPVEDQAASRSSKRSARMVEARRKGTHTASEWSAMLAICNNACVKCGASGRLEKDHIQPVYADGSDAIDNLQPLCPRCNCAKGADQTDRRPNNWKALLPTAVGNLRATGAYKGQGEGQGESSDPDGSGAAAPEMPPSEPIPDPEKVMFAAGLRLLAEAGVSEAKARPLIGRWKRDHGAEAVLTALGKAQREGVIDPVSFIEGVFRHGNERVRGGRKGTAQPDGFTDAIRQASGSTDRWAARFDG